MDYYVQHLLKSLRYVFKQYPQVKDIPMNIYYAMAITTDNLYMYLLFRYCHPEDIKLDYTALLG